MYRVGDNRTTKGMYMYRVGYNRLTKGRYMYRVGYNRLLKVGICIESVTIG